MRNDVDSLFCNKAARVWFRIFAILVSFYIATTRVLASVYPESIQKWFKLIIYLALILIFTILIYYLILWVTVALAKKNKHEPGLRKKAPRFVLYTLIAFIPLFITFLYYFPGGTSPDTVNQWKQVQAFTFNNWHPVFHTLLIWLASRIVNAYAFVVLIQMLAFSFGIGYLFSTLDAKGISRKALFLVLFLTVFNTTTRNQMTYLWKDSAMSISILFLTAMLINIYLSDGAWLSSWRNVAAVSVLMAVTTLVRHNACFFTVPLAIILIIAYRREKKTKWVVLSALALVLLVRFPLYSALDVTYPDNTVAEAAGLPMTIMGDVLVQNPDALSDTTKEFLLSIAPEEEWQAEYELGNYNSVKFSFNASEIVNATSPYELIRMTLSTIRNDPFDSVEAVTKLTSIAWDSSGEYVYELSPTRGSSSLGEAFTLSVNKIGEILISPIDVIDDFIPSVFVKSVGFCVACLLFCFTVTLPRNRFKSLLLVLPALCYNFGTMLLLAGDDYRFFHFNILVSYPICLVLLLAKRDAAAE